MTVVVRHPNKNEQRVGHKPETLFWIASTKRSPSQANERIFRDLSINRINPKYLKRHIAAKRLPSYINQDGTIKERYAVEAWLLPEQFQSFRDSVKGDLHRAIECVAKLIRWRYDLPGRHGIGLAFVEARWSFNGTSWFELPFRTGGIALIQGEQEPLNINCVTINALARKEIQEPLAHELYREASNQRGTRSALVMLVAAAETAFKHFVVSVCPDTEWLVANIQSPPLVKMLKEYLPNLPAARTINGKVLPPPDDVLEVLEEAIRRRNDIVHGRRAKIDRGDGKDVDAAVKDLMGLLDFYAGFDWALEQIRPETRRALDLPELPLSHRLKDKQRVVRFGSSAKSYE